MTFLISYDHSFSYDLLFSLVCLADTNRQGLAVPGKITVLLSLVCVIT